LKFTTPGGKTVYGGGGIMPDKFVAADTSGITPYLLKIRPLIYQYALEYTEANRDALKKHNTPVDMANWLDMQGLQQKFTSFVVKNKINPDPEGIRISGKIILVQLKGYIARNILDNKGAYPIWEDIDTTMKYAVDFLGK
jgi:carboxyl-terminal processing protease